MYATVATMEILVWSTIETTKTFDFVFHSMRVYDVHYHSDAEFMSFVDKAF